ncbi:unnamed protein product, partial [Mesorhabditis belari]|uniref:Thyroid transcription factor 1-associated protein 26 n=1 Tax=Mesorhabditis belari TaxID=2138241 RepID=A0AAF3EG11_9BILA
MDSTKVKKRKTPQNRVEETGPSKVIEVKSRKRSREQGEPIKKKKKRVVDRFEELDAVEKKEMNQEIAQFEGRKRKQKNFERARQTFERIQDNRQAEREQKFDERKKKGEAIQRYQEGKKKMLNALKKTNRKGQPNLNAQVSVLLEKIQKQMDK